MSFRELVLILLIAAVGAVLIYFETGRDRAVLATAAIMLSIFALGGLVAVVAV